MLLRRLGRYGATTWARRARHLALLAACAAYALLFGPLFALAGSSAAALAALPALVAAWFYGALPGVVAALLGWAAMLPLLLLSGHEGEIAATLLITAVPMALLPVIALGVSRLRTLRDRLADQVAAHRRTQTALERSERLFRSVIEQSADGVAIVDDTGYVLLWNGAEEAITGIPASEALGAHLADLQYAVLPEAERTPERRESLRRHVASLRDVASAAWFGRRHDRVIRSRDGAIRTVESVYFPISLEGRRLFGSTNRDVTEQRRAEALVAASLQEKEVLLREVHHRVKNNLQVVASLLELQSDYVSDPMALAQLGEAQLRIRSMALIHESLHRSADLALVDIAQYLRALVEQLAESHGVDADRVRVAVEAAHVRLSADAAIPCGLIVNELVSNSLKHAFPGGRSGRVDVAVRQRDAAISLDIADDGVGLSPDLDFRRTRTLGLQLVTMLVAQLGGEISRRPGPGTAFHIAFPLPEERGHTPPCGEESS